MNRLSGPITAIQISRSPNPNGPINARQRCCRSAGEWIGSLAVLMCGIGNAFTVMLPSWMRGQNSRNLLSTGRSLWITNLTILPCHGSGD